MYRDRFAISDSGANALCKQSSRGFILANFPNDGVVINTGELQSKLR